MNYPDSNLKTQSHLPPKRLFCPLINLHGGGGVERQRDRDVEVMVVYRKAPDTPHFPHYQECMSYKIKQLWSSALWNGYSTFSSFSTTDSERAFFQMEGRRKNIETGRV